MWVVAVIVIVIIIWEAVESCLLRVYLVGGRMVVGWEWDLGRDVGRRGGGM